MSGIDDNDLHQDGNLGDAFEDAEKVHEPGDDKSKAPPAETVLEREAPPLSNFFDAAVKHAIDRATGRAKPVPVPWPTMAEKLDGGLWPGAHILVGTTGSGKSQLALQIALHAAIAGAPVLYIGLELTPIQIFWRLISLIEVQERLNAHEHPLHIHWDNTKWSEYYRGKVSEKQIHEAVRAYEKLIRDFCFHQINNADLLNWRYQKIEQMVTAMHEKYCAGKENKLPLFIVLDYLQIISGEERELRERIGNAAKAVRNAAMKSNASLLILSSTARENYTKMGGDDTKTGLPPGQGNARVLVGLGKESGEIEYSADTVFVMTQESWSTPEPPADGTRVHLALAKNRNGEAGWIPLRFNGNFFWEHDEEKLESMEL